MKIAFLGLGIMGRPMASKLAAAGHEVSVWNRSARQHVDGAGVELPFLGLGMMGRPMASKLAAAGHEVSVWTRSARQHVDGATTAVSPADAAKDAEPLRAAA